jgi:hypothetical protein
MMPAGIYQGTLHSFPELKRPYKYFSENPIVNGGYKDTTPSIPKLGIFYSKGKRVQDNHGNWVTSTSQTLWSTEPLLQGYFVEFEGVVYRLMNDSDRARQGGFFIYDLTERIGNSTRQQFAPVAETGANEFT